MDQSNMNETLPATPIFSTRDLYLSATLMTLRFPLLGMDFQVEGTRNQPIGYFKFEDTPQLEDARRRYMQGQLAVEPRLYVANMDSLKAEISNIRNNPSSRYA
jgi:hypothetical protein